MDDLPLLQAEDLIFELGPGGPGRRIDFRLAGGRGLHLVGHSGAGKTTLLRVLARLRPRLGGRLILAGRLEAEVSPSRWRRRVMYLPQHPVMLPGPVGDNLAYPFRLAGSEGSFDPSRAQEMLAAAGLKPDLSGPTKTLSGGEAARVGLVRALLTGPEVLLADEPLAYLDENSARRTIALLSEFMARGGGLILVSHQAPTWERPDLIDRIELEEGDDDRS